MAGPGVVGMAVRDHGPLDRAHRVDMEAARLAAEAGGSGHQDVLRAHARLYRTGVELTVMRGLDPRSILELMPARLFLSSGDLMADRRFDFARDLQLKGDLAAAADLLMQAIELAPNFTSAWFTLGDIREELGEHRGGDCGVSKGAGQRSRRPPRRRPAIDAAWRRAGVRHAAGLCANAVRSICAAVRILAGGRSRLSRPGAAVQGGAVGAIGRPQAGASSSAPSISAAAPGLRPPPSPARSIISSASICRRA